MLSLEVKVVLGAFLGSLLGAAVISNGIMPTNGYSALPSKTIEKPILVSQESRQESRQENVFMERLEDMYFEAIDTKFEMLNQFTAITFPDYSKGKWGIANKMDHKYYYG